MKARVVLVEGIKVMIKEMPNYWEGTLGKNVTSGYKVLNVWTNPSLNGRRERFNLYYYQDDSFSGGGVRHYKDIAQKAIEQYFQLA